MLSFFFSVRGLFLLSSSCLEGSLCGVRFLVSCCVSLREEILLVLFLGVEEKISSPGSFVFWMKTRKEGKEKKECQLRRKEAEGKKKKMYLDTFLGVYDHFFIFATLNDLLQCIG